METQSEKKTEIVRFIKDEKGNRTGVVIAKLYDTNEVIVSFSKSHQFLDAFDRVKALNIARGRADSFFKKRRTDNAPRLHTEVQPVFQDMLQRAASYFKEKTIVPLPYKEPYADIGSVEQNDRAYDNDRGRYRKNR